MQKEHSRRQFLRTAGLGAAASVAGGLHPLAASSVQAGNARGSSKSEPKGGLRLGLASYTLRKFSLEQAIEMTERLALEYICLKSMHLPLESAPEKIEQAAAQVRQAGLKLYGCGVVYMKTEEEVNRAFEYAARAGMTTIVGVPQPDLLAFVDEKVRKYDIQLAIHNHGPGDKLYPTPASAYERIEKLDRRIGLCIDIGHTKRAGVDPASAAEKFTDRLLDLHLKDVTSGTAEGRTVEAGRGVIDIPKFLETLLRIRYGGIVSFEYEKDAQDPLPGLAESVGYVRGALAVLMKTS